MSTSGRALATVMLAGLAAAACDPETGPPGVDGGAGGNGSGGGVSFGCFDYEGFLPKQVSFEKDVLPIFQQTCNLVLCHSSDSPAPREGLVLGPQYGQPVTAADVDTVHGGLVGVAAKRAPNMVLVEPSDPLRSFLMAKLEYDDPSACSEVECGPDGCGTRQPPVVMPLYEDQLVVIRSWILAGASK